MKDMTYIIKIVTCGPQRAGLTSIKSGLFQ